MPHTGLLAVPPSFGNLMRAVFGGGLALAAILFDVVEVSLRSGLAALLAMALTTLWLAWDLELRSSSSRDLKALRDLFKFELALMLGCATLTAARAYLWYRQLVAPVDSVSVSPESVRLYGLVFIAVALGGELVLWRARSLARLLARLAQRPPLLLAISFATMIVVSTLLLCMPWSVHDVQKISLLDAWFTSTSAVCVTGLAVNDIGSTYTNFGELVILLAIQFGGIGIMSLSALALTFRQDASLVSQAQYASMFEVDSLSELRGLVRTIVSSTFAIEAVGAVLLWFSFDGDPRIEGRNSVWCAVFHSVSAFCNAGFSLFPKSLGPFTTALAPQCVIMSLIVLGGLGFPVYRVLFARLREVLVARAKRRTPRLERFDLTGRVVLLASALLVLGGTAAYAVLEWNGALRELSYVERCFAALFASVTTRTAGFNTVEFGAMGSPALLITVVLMFIGGSPSSTAGGVKTTTAAVLFASFAGEMRGHDPRLGARVLGSETLRRATSVTVSAASTLTAVVFLLCLTEAHAFLPLLFEAASALGTVGLSTGITAELSALGRVVLIGAMFFGRIGPMTVALAIGRRAMRERFRYPSDEVSIW
ncbi:MAG: hypothetical protein IT454_06240 [Planctomycetes bacterium]|nr:hypothetical protein [Planctomycetota bacterium]